MKRGLFISLLILVPVFASFAEPPPPQWGLNLALSGEVENLDRAIGGLGLEVDISRLRILAQSSLESTSREAPSTEGALWAVGLEDQLTGSALFDGRIAPTGLLKRLTGPLCRLPPLADNRPLTRAEVLPTQTENDNRELFACIAGRRSAPLRLSAATRVSETSRMGSLGFELRPRPFSRLKLEGLLQQRELSPRPASSWFCEAPPLPGQRCQLRGLAMNWVSPSVSLGLDAAYSESELSGEGFYGNLALRAGEEPTRFDLALDGSRGPFIGADGKTAAEELRALASLRHRFKRGSLLSLRLRETREPPWGHPQDTEAALSWSSGPSTRKVRFAAASLSLGGRNPEGEKRSWSASSDISLQTGRLELALCGGATAEEVAGRLDCTAWRTRLSLSRPWGNFLFGAGLGLNGMGSQSPKEDFSASASWQKGRFRSKLSLAACPKTGTHELSITWSWRRGWRGPLR